MKFIKIFTQYDEKIEKTLEVDPLGFVAIWTYFGQNIFHNKISSVASDIRSFNINLFNHFLIKSIASSGSKTLQNQFEKNHKESVEKLILILENMLIWSWYREKGRWGESKNGLLGTSKAITKWEESQINLDITDKIENLELLKRQKTTGVNGRYKGAFIAMDFFDSNYDDESYFNDKLFDEVENIVENNKALNELYKSLLSLFQDDSLDINKIPISLFTNAFKDIQTTAKDTQLFWLDKLGLERDEAKVIYEQISEEDEVLTWDDVKNLFTNAYEELESPNIKIILELEKKLSYLDGLLDYLIFYDNEEIKKVSEKKYFKNLQKLSFENEIDAIKKDCVAKKRLIELHKINSIDSLINYHNLIMQERGHNPWIKNNDGVIETNIKKVTGKEELEEKLSVDLDSTIWIHDYYMSSLVSIKKGFSYETI